MKETFIVNYDELTEDVIEVISSKLKNFGLTINIVEGGDGWLKYEIVKI